MDYKNHLKTGAMAGLVVLDSIYTKNMMDNSDLVLFSIGTIIGSSLPDIDHHKSYIAKNLSFVGWTVSRFFSHRGFTHSLSFMLILRLAAVLMEDKIPYEYSAMFEFFSLGTIVGVGTHILMDIFVGNGVKLLFPIYNKKIYLMKMKSGTDSERTFMRLVFILFFFYMAYYGNTIKIILS